MPISTAEGLLAAVSAYAAIGALVVVWLLALGGLRRLDAAAAEAPVLVKALWLPGMLALWPALLLRAAGLRAPEDRA